MSNGNDYINPLINEFNNANNLFELNNGPAINSFDIIGQRHSSFFLDLLERLIARDRQAAYDCIYESFVIKENIFKKNIEAIGRIRLLIDREATSYSEYANIAYDSLAHKNYILFYVMINFLNEKLSASQRYFFDDRDGLKQAERRTKQLSGMNPNSYSDDFENLEWPHYFFQEISTDIHKPIYEFGAKEVTNSLNPESIFYKPNSDGKSDFDFEYAFIERAQCIERKSMRPFIIECEKFINKRLLNQSVENSAEIFSLLFAAVTYDYIISPNPWSDDLSKYFLIIVNSSISYCHNIPESKKLCLKLDMVNIFLFYIRKTLRDKRLKQQKRYNKTLLHIINLLLNLNQIFELAVLPEYIDDVIKEYSHVFIGRELDLFLNLKSEFEASK